MSHEQKNAFNTLKEKTANQITVNGESVVLSDTLIANISKCIK